MPELVVDLNASAWGLISDIGATGGGVFALGAEIDASNTDPNNPLAPTETIWSGGTGKDAAQLQFTLVPEIDGGAFASIAFILGALGLWLYSGAARGRPEETSAAA